ncbi:metal ABC transporter solute-binding protein, Zn/Mn family [Trueperella bialowiezensis]|uniref:Probable zinc transport system zinc-binding lipoprotein AdcA n=1 Tax=Trueperella bialowiezensis TaxID=312285 RepID=A0A448PDF8_9ACTO|nr:zinc ABC transporter substrate-binding protein [Trueperella bialowiezensis]VEI12973.1 Probable zinc transport system zinc-binding lipoprotein AdcA precursor [Trueperella bialowiezensis]
MSLSRRAFLGIAAAALAAAAASCSPGGVDTEHGPSDGRPVVYASFYPIRSLVEEVAGDEIEVRSFMPDGHDPHMWEPSPQAMKGLAEADLLVVNGANMEAWLPQVEQNFPDLPILKLSEYVDLITYKGAAAIGEFQYLAASPLVPGDNYRLVFGHTHEKNMRAVFFTAPEGTSQDDLVKLGRKTMESEGTPVAQKEDFELVDGEVLDIAMGHESGTVSFKVPEGDANWYFAADRVSQDILSYRIVEEDGTEMPTVPVIDGSSSGTDTITFDPHSWMSVINAKRYCNAIESTLSEQFPEHAKTFSKNRFDTVREITALQAEYKEKFSEAEQKEFVVSHNAFGYLARDFGLQQLSLQGLTTNEAPSLYSLVYSIRYVREAGIDTVYQEYGVQDPGIQIVVEEVDGRVLPLASMEHTNPRDELYEGGYIAYMEMNLANLAESIK